MGFFLGYYSSMIILVPAIIFTFYAQAKVKGAFNKYARIASSRGITGAQAAETILRANGLSVPIRQISGSLTDNYDPTKKILNLSQSVYGSASVAAIGVAAHECGHAIQHANGYAALKIRNSIIPLVNFGSTASWPLLMIGLVFSGDLGDTLFSIGVLLFGFTVLFHLITLPVELDASRRALKQLEGLGIIEDKNEYRGAKKVLSAAAMTYMASLAMAIANLLRILAMRHRRD